MNATQRAVAGAVIFSVGVVWFIPHPHQPAWAHVLLVFAALVLVPLLLDGVREVSDDAKVASALGAAVRLQFPAALLLLVAVGRDPGGIAALWAVPWVVMLGLLAGVGAMRLWRRGLRPLSLLLREGGLVYSAVGGAWLMADRLGLHPLGFSDAIVLLTAVHFHYAGLLLPVLTGRTLGVLSGSRAAAVTGMGVLIGVPAVAVGITASQLGLGPVPEAAAALLMAGSGFGVAALHWQLAWQNRWMRRVRWLWALAAVSLAVGMIFAAVYGVRNFFHPWPWLDLAWMRALHGTANALGFGLAGTLAWRLSDRSHGKGVEPGRINVRVKE